MPAVYPHHVRHAYRVAGGDSDDGAADYVANVDNDVWRRITSPAITVSPSLPSINTSIMDMLRFATLDVTPSSSISVFLRAPINISSNETEDVWQADYHPPVAAAFSDSILLLTFVCTHWQEAQHALYQMANLCLALAFLTPHTFTLHHVITRAAASLAFALLAALSAFVHCQPDTIIWYIVLLTVNLSYLFHALCCEQSVTFEPELEDVFAKMFEPLGVTRHQYRQLVSVAHGVDMPADTTYALACVTRTGEKLSIVIAGQLQVTQDGMTLHSITANQFVDSLEYDRVMSAYGSNDTFQVNIRTTEECRLITWPVRDLVTYLHRKPFMHAVFTCLVGKDIVHKLNSVQDTVAQHPGFLQLTRHRFERASLVRWKHHMNQGPWRVNPKISLTSANGFKKSSCNSGSDNSLTFGV